LQPPGFTEAAAERLTVTGAHWVFCAFVAVKLAVGGAETQMVLVMVLRRQPVPGAGVAVKVTVYVPVWVNVSEKELFKLEELGSVPVKPVFGLIDHV
jgi:hypothetical protein